MTLNTQVLTDVRLYFHTADLTGFSNKVEFKAMREALDRTTWGDYDSTTGTVWRTRVGGLFDSSIDANGFWQAGDMTMPDDAFWTELGVSSVPLTAVPHQGASGDLAYVTRVLESAYTPGGQVGQLFGWSAAMRGNWPVTRGKILHPQGTARTTSGNGTGYQLGALSATQALYVNLHVLSYVDGSLTVTVESDDNSGFTSATTRATFTASTALDGQTAKVSGAVTDDWWRATWTITGGATHSFLFAVSAGIGPK